MKKEPKKKVTKSVRSPFVKEHPMGSLPKVLNDFKTMLDEMKQDLMKPKLQSFTIKAVITTGPYSNIQPEITVTAETLEEADKMVMPYIDELFKKYLNISERENKNEKLVNEVKVAVGVQKPQKKVEKTIVTVASAMASEAFLKASNAINTAFTAEAIIMLRDRVKMSEKLTIPEKQELFDMLTQRDVDIIGKPEGK